MNSIISNHMFNIWFYAEAGGRLQEWTPSTHCIKEKNYPFSNLLRKKPYISYNTDVY